MPRTCYVIMPFSKTASCSTKNWTWIYENLFKKAVEESGLDYECKRSSATRGSIIKGIIHDLDESYVVIADLTDQSPNVFYELGIRHSLGPRTILVAQRRKQIPFDLRGYASHIYDWKSEKGRNELKRRIKALLKEIDQNPDRSDNPVSDFLKRNSVAEKEIDTEMPKEVIPLSIVGPDIDIDEIVKRLRS